MTHRVQGLAKEVPGSLQLCAAIALHELAEVGPPDVPHMGPLEERDAPLVHLEGLLPVLVLLQTVSKACQREVSQMEV